MGECVEHGGRGTSTAGHRHGEEHPTPFALTAVRYQDNLVGQHQSRARPRPKGSNRPVPAGWPAKELRILIARRHRGSTRAVVANAASCCAGPRATDISSTPNLDPGIRLFLVVAKLVPRSIYREPSRGRSCEAVLREDTGHAVPSGTVAVATERSAACSQACVSGAVPPTFGAPPHSRRMPDGRTYSYMYHLLHRTYSYIYIYTLTLFALT